MRPVLLVEFWRMERDASWEVLVLFGIFYTRFLSPFLEYLSLILISKQLNFISLFFFFMLR